MKTVEDKGKSTNLIKKGNPSKKDTEDVLLRILDLRLSS